MDELSDLFWKPSKNIPVNTLNNRILQSDFETDGRHDLKALLRAFRINSSALGRFFVSHKDVNRRSRKLGWTPASKFFLLISSCIVFYLSHPVLNRNKLWIDDQHHEFHCPAIWSHRSRPKLIMSHLEKPHCQRLLLIWLPLPENWILWNPFILPGNITYL